MTKRFKIEPDLTCPELAGYKLPPVERRQDIDAETEYPTIGHENTGIYNIHRSMQEGYNKAREKYQFTEDDMKYIFECGRNYQNNAEVTFKVSIAHLRTPRNPIAIEVEMRYYYKDCIQFYDTDTIWVECYKSRFDELKKSTMIETKEVPKLNPDGTVKGRWVYE